MARTVLTDDEMAGLVRKILMPGYAQEIRDWMSWLPNVYTPRNPEDQDEAVRLKDLGFRDFRMQFLEFKSENGSVVAADIQIWRGSKWLNGEAKRIFDHLFLSARERYPEGSFRSKHVRGFAHNFVLASELQLTLERSSAGGANSDETHIRNDFVCFIFRRLYW